MSNPKFQARHYVTIADAIAVERSKYPEVSDKDEALRQFALSLTDIFAGDNLRFDETRFLLACEPDNRP
jgi:hypothetical protein